MAAGERRTVGSVLRYWMEQTDVTPSTLARQAGLSRATVYVVLNDRKVNAETLSKLANGLARDGMHRGPDAEVAALISRELHNAAGYGLPGEPSTPMEAALPDLSARLSDLMGDPLAASRLVAVIREWPALDAIDRSILLSVIEATAQRRPRADSHTSVSPDPLDRSANVARGAGPAYVEAWHRMSSLMEHWIADPDKGPQNEATYLSHAGDVEAAYRTLVETAGQVNTVTTSGEAAPQEVRGALHSFRQFISRGEQPDWPSDPSMSRDWPLTWALMRIWSGMHMAGVSEQPMILEILNTIAERLVPTEGPADERQDRSDVNQSRREGGRLLEI